MRVVLTGASSFTGFWFARTLAARGVDVVAPLSGARESYSGVRAQRLALLQPVCELAFDRPFGSRSFLDFVAAQPAVDVFCHHWSDVRDYRSPDFDALRALAQNVRSLPELLRILRDRTCAGFVLTGSIGEQREGLGQDRRAFSPYGLSKGLTSDVAAFECGRAGVAFDKFVIPNPFGPYEEARFTHYLMRTWAAGQMARVMTPDYVRDNIFADVLAMAYADFVLSRRDRPAMPPRRLAPSLYAETQGRFTQRLAGEVKARTGWACDLHFDTQTDFAEPLSRVNVDPACALAPQWNEAAAWDGFVTYYLEALKAA